MDLRCMRMVYFVFFLSVISNLGEHGVWARLLDSKVIVYWISNCIWLCLMVLIVSLCICIDVLCGPQTKLMRYLFWNYKV